MRVKSTLLTAGLSGFLCLSACSPQEESALPADAPPALLGDMHINSIDRIIITDKEGSVTLQKDGAKWKITEPLYFPVHMPMLVKFMVQLEEAVLGQQVNISENDYAYLSLIDPESEEVPEEVVPVKVELLSDTTDETRRFILGQFDVPDDKESVTIIGQKGLARRFVRLLSGDGGVYLCQHPLFYAIPSGNMWAIRNFLPTKGVKEVKGLKDGEEKWSIGRKSAFGKPEVVGLNADFTLNTKQAEIFNDLFNAGLFAGVVPRGREAEFMPPEETRVLEITSFDGRKHTVEVGKLIKPVDYRDPSKGLADGVISFAPVQSADPIGAYTIRIRFEIPEKVKYDSGQVEPFKDRVIIIEQKDIAPLLELFDAQK